VTDANHPFPSDPAVAPLAEDAGPARSEVVRHRRRWPLVAALTAAAVVAGSAVAYADARKSVTLDVDGHVTQLTTFAGSVDGLLRAQGVRLGDHDVVSPSADAGLREGAEVVVRYGRQLDLSVDGKRSEAWVTALDADDALDRLAARGSDVRLVASRSGERLELPLRLAADGAPVAVVADGVTRTGHDTGAGVEGLLADVGVTVDDDDRVSVAGADEAGVADAQGADVAVVVQRVDVRDVRKKSAIPFRHVRKTDPGRYADLGPKVVQEGKAGVHTRVLRITTVDGHETLRRLVREKDTKAPVDQVTVVGTKERPKPTAAPAPKPTQRSTSTSASSPAPEPAPAPAPATGDVWAKLAQCESGGNPRANTGNGYYGLYQFSLGTWQAMGGSGLPSDASAAEQTQRAKALQARSGWGQWPACARKLGLL
jgi:uncharacterized protein YabE (DUF348 family)